MERYVAIDNVCAWPCLNLAPDGTLRATLFNQPTHGGCEGDTDCWASDDEGRSWQRLGTVHPHEPGTNNGLNHAAGFAADGTFVVITNGRDNRPPAGQVLSAQHSNILPPLVCRSSDGGHSWVNDGTVVPPASGDQGPVAFGRINRLADGQLAVTLHTCGDLWVYRSSDHGRTWEKGACIATTNYNETCLLTSDSGPWLVAARTYDDQHLDLYRSTDQGTSWSFGGALTQAGQIPGSLLRLKDGTLLLTYGIRNPGLRGLGYRCSKDDGVTWSRPGVLLDFGMITDGGYPSSVELADGTIVTAYYAGATPAHTRYHMGILRWRLSDLKEPGAFTQSYAAGRQWQQSWAGVTAADPGHVV